MSDTVRSIGLFHLAEERRRLQKHTEVEKPDQAAMSMYKRSWDDIHAAARSMHALMRSTSISSGWAARSCSIMPNACNTVAGFGRPGAAGRCFRDRVSADLRLLCAAAAAGRQSLGSSFWSTWALTRARRGRQAVFREQFLAHLGFNSGPARPAAARPAGCL